MLTTDRRPTTDRPLILRKFQMAIAYLRAGSSDSLHVPLQSMVFGSADRMALFRVGPNSIGMWGKTMREE